MARTYPRAERVERLAREVLGEALQGLKDPRIGFATVTGVKMSPDLRQARVYVSVRLERSSRETGTVSVRPPQPASSPSTASEGPTTRDFREGAERNMRPVTSTT